MLKSKAEKCNLLATFSDTISISVSEYDIKNSECEKTFEKHITDICRKASRKIYALARIAPCMDLSKRSMFMNALFNP